MRDTPSAAHAVEGEIQHLDFDIEALCEGLHPDGPVPPAQFRCIQHGCDVFLFCAACEDRERLQIERTFAAGGTVTCRHCRHTFTTLTACIQVQPL